MCVSNARCLKALVFRTKTDENELLSHLMCSFVGEMLTNSNNHELIPTPLNRFLNALALLGNQQINDPMNAFHVRLTAYLVYVCVWIEKNVLGRYKAKIKK